MKMQNEIWTWRERKLNSTLAVKTRGATAKRVGIFKPIPGLDDALPAQPEPVEEAYLCASKNFRSILHEARNTMTALLLTLENVTDRSHPQAAFDETVETLKQLSNRLNGSIEKLGALFPDSKITNLEN